MAALPSKTALGGAIGDTYDDALGQWVVQQVFFDGVYAWSLTPLSQDVQALKDAFNVDYVNIYNGA